MSLCPLSSSQCPIDSVSTHEDAYGLSMSETAAPSIIFSPITSYNMLKHKQSLGE